MSEHRDGCRVEHDPEDDDLCMTLDELRDEAALARWEADCDDRGYVTRRR